MQRIIVVFLTTCGLLLPPSLPGTSLIPLGGLLLLMINSVLIFVGIGVVGYFLLRADPIVCASKSLMPELSRVGGEVGLAQDVSEVLRQMA